VCGRELDSTGTRQDPVARHHEQETNNRIPREKSNRSIKMAKFPPSKESNQLSKWIRKFQKINSESEQAKRPNP
jgi:hypothetical protein